MPDPHYPSVDIDFIEQHVTSSGKLAIGGIVKIGSTTAYVLEGNQAIYKRTITIRELSPGQICFEQAMALAYKFMFFQPLSEWLEKHRSWKEGAYFEKAR